MLYNNIKEKIYTAEGSLEGAFFRIAWPPSWGPWFLSSSCCSIFGGSELREPGLSERLRAPGAGEYFGAPLRLFGWKVGKFDLVLEIFVRKLNFYFENSKI